jgi:regulator of replication initiation timing|nr:MAG TPA: hypothetical protein [Caudoviricetes sp.]
MATKKTEDTVQDSKAPEQLSNEDIMSKLNEVIESNKKLQEENKKLRNEQSNVHGVNAEPVDPEKQAALDRMNEKVPVKLFKDNGKYKDDLVVQLAGVAYQIKRGITVMVPRAVYDIIRRSELQDQHTANMLDALQEEYAKKNS